MLTRKFRMILGLGLVVSLFFAGAGWAASGDYPRKPIMIQSGFPPGGSSTIAAQVFAEGLKKYINQSVMIDYKPGASTAIAADYVLKLPADGYNLFWANGDLMGKLAKDKDQLRFNLDSFYHIGTVALTPYVLLVSREKSPLKTFDEFLAYAKKNPGGLSAGIAGVGSSSHVTLEALQSKCGIVLNQVPFLGGAEIVAAVLGGHADLTSMTAATVRSQTQPGGGLRTLVTFAEERWHELPDVPTCIEKGYKVTNVNWYGLAAKKGTPKRVLDVLEAAFKKTADDPKVKESLFGLGFKAVNWGPEQAEKNARQMLALANEMLKKK